MVLTVFAEDLVHIWTGNPQIASSVAPIISLLAVGSALHGVMHFPYALQLAYGMTRLPLTINTILMVVLVPLILFFSLAYGALGAAMAWLVLHLFYVLLGSWLTHRSLLKGVGARWLLQDVGIPLALSFGGGLIGHHYVAGNEDFSIVVKLLGGGGLVLAASTFSILVSHQLRTVILRIF